MGKARAGDVNLGIVRCYFEGVRLDESFRK